MRLLGGDQVIATQFYYLPSPMMYIGAAAGKRNSGTGGAGGAGPPAPPIFVKSKALAVMRVGSAFQFPGKKQRKEIACQYILDTIGENRIDRIINGFICWSTTLPMWQLASRSY